MLDFLESQGSLEEVLKRHVKPYDSVSDDYARPPFAADVVSPGRSKFYNFHYYLTKVPPESIAGLIIPTMRLYWSMSMMSSRAASP